MKYFFIAVLLLAGFATHAQFTNATLKASGLTCSMCSKAVKTALDKVAFIEKVAVDIRNQEYNIQFKKDAAVDFDQLSKAVEDAGFAIALLKVSGDFSGLKAAPDQHLKIGNTYFHLMNGNGQALENGTSITLVDKNFVTAKEHKKWSAASAHSCVQTGKASACCEGSGAPAGARMYHATI